MLVAGGENQVAIYQLDTGKLVWQAKVDGDAVGLVADGGRLYVSTDQGKIYGFEAKGVAPTTTAVTASIFTPTWEGSRNTLPPSWRSWPQT